MQAGVPLTQARNCLSQLDKQLEVRLRETSGNSIRLVEVVAMLKANQRQSPYFCECGHRGNPEFASTSWACQGVQGEADSGDYFEVPNGLVVFPEQSGCMADGATRQEAIQNVEIVIQKWIETTTSLGREIPEPRGRLLFAEAS